MTDLSVSPQRRAGHRVPDDVLHRSPAPAATPATTGAAGRFVDVVAIGDITVTADSVLLPQGRYPLAGTTWTVQDSTKVVKRSPRYARVLAAVFAVVLVGLLFLLIKERRYAGFVLVTVVGEGLYHTVRFPPGPESTAQVASLVNRARALSAGSV